MAGLWSTHASKSEYTQELIKPVLVDGRGYSKSDRIQTAKLVERVTVRTTEGEDSEEDSSKCSAPHPKHSFRDYIRSGLLDSKLKAIGFERSGDTPADGNCLIHGKYYLSSG